MLPEGKNEMTRFDEVKMVPIGIFNTDAVEIPRHWSISDVEGTLVIDQKYTDGLSGIEPGQKIVVLFHFHKSPAFDPSRHLRQIPPHRDRATGVFSICSPVRPNPIGMSVLTVLDVCKNRITVKGADMINDTPILDIKPHIDRKVKT